MRMNAGAGATPGQQVDAVAAAIILEGFFGSDAERAGATALHVPPTRPAWRPSEPKPPRPVPPPASELQRQMRERVADQLAADRKIPGMGRNKKKRKR